MSVAGNRARALLLVGVLLAVVSLGLPWRSIPGTPGYVTIGSYTSGYCDVLYCYSGTYEPGVYVPGTSGGSYPGTSSDIRFFVATALALVLLGALWRGQRRALRWAAYVGLAGLALYLPVGLTGGALALVLACACWWWAARTSVLGRGRVPAVGA